MSVRRSVVVLSIVLLAAAGFFALEHWVSLGESGSALQGRDVARSAFGSRKLLRVLNQLEVIHPDFRQAITRDSNRDLPKHVYRYGVNALPPEEMPSTMAVPPDWRERELPLLSLVLAPADYRGLVRNPDRRGRSSERFAYASFFKDGDLLFATGAGLRVHGGLSRWTSPNKSLRLYFRDDLGASEVAGELVFEPGSEALRRLVLHNDVRLDKQGQAWHFIRPFGYDIAERFGAPVPRTSPAWLLVNGAPVGVYVLTEYLDRHYLETRFGHSEFMLVRERKNPADVPLELGPEEEYRKLRRWVNGLPRRLPMKEAARHLDVENLSRWFLAVLFCGATDSLQGPAIRDLRASDSRWSWITWDLDHSFKDEWLVKPGQEPWEIDVFQSIVVYSGRERRSQPPAIRSQILLPLMRTVRYRRYLARLYQDLMNHEVTPDFLRERFEHYRDLSQRMGVDNRTFDSVVPGFLEHRPRVLREQLGRHLGAGSSFQITANGSRACPIVVDGREKTTPYDGWYFADTSAELAPAGACEGFSHWEVNGENVPERTLDLKVQEDLEIRAVTLG